MRWAAMAASAALVFASAPAAADEPSADERAEELNEAGRQRVRVLDLDGAATKFRAAIELSPDPRYYFNLCYVLEKLGELREARAACQVVVDADTDAALEGKASGTLAAIDAALAAGEKAEEPAPARESELETTAGPAGEPPAPIEVPPAPEKPLSVGVAAGLSSTTFAADEGDFSRQLGVSVGAEIEARLIGPLSVAGGAGISRRGAKFHPERFDLLDPVDVNLSYVDVPLLVRLTLGGDVAAVVDAGAAVSLLVDYDDGPGLLEEEISPGTFDVAAVVGAGVRFGASTRVSIGLQYVHGFIDVAEAERYTLHNRSVGAVVRVSF